MKTPERMSIDVQKMLLETRAMSTRGVGAYTLNLLIMWFRGGQLVGDEELLRRIARLDRRQWKIERAEIIENLDQIRGEDGRIVWRHQLISEAFDRACWRSQVNARNARRKPL